MITRFSDQMPPVDTGLSKLLVQIAGDQKITKTMSDATLHTLQAHLKGRQQDHVMDIGQTSPTYERRQEPLPENSVIDHEADVSQPASSSCSCLDDDSVLTARLRQPRQDYPCLIMAKKLSPGTSALGSNRLAKCSDTEDLPAPGGPVITIRSRRFRGKGHRTRYANLRLGRPWRARVSVGWIVL